MKVRHVMAVATIAALAGCSHAVPKPGPATAMRLDFTGPPSVLSLDIKADLSNLNDYVLREMPEEMHSDPGSDRTWNFRREAANLAIEEGRLVIEARYRGRIESRSFFQNCILDPVVPVVRIAMTPAISEEDDSWVVQAQDPDISIDLDKESDTTCTIFEVDVAAEVKKGLNDRKVKDKIRESLKNAKKGIGKKRLSDLLNEVVKVKVAPLDAKICLYPQVNEVVVSGFQGTLQDVSLQARVTGHPVAIFATTCPDNPSRPAVTLKSGDIGEGKYTVAIHVAIPYDEVTHQLRRALEGETLTLSEHTFWVERIAAANLDGKLLIKAFTRGYIDGEIDLWGKPVFDGNCDKIRMKDIDFAAMSGDWLDSTKIALASLRHGSIVEKISSKAVFDISDRCEALRDKLGGRHDFGALNLSVTVDELAPQGEIESRDDAIIATIRLTGKAAAEIRP